MGYNPITGQTLEGKQLPSLAPNASKEEQATVINEIIDVLNNYSRDVVSSGVATVQLSAGNNLDILTVPHNLGYKPQAYCYLGNRTISTGSQTYSGVDLSLPTPVHFGSDGTNIVFADYLTFFVDDTNLYIMLFLAVNAVSNVSIDVQYYLTRNPAGIS